MSADENLKNLNIKLPKANDLLDHMLLLEYLEIYYTYLVKYQLMRMEI